MLKLFYPLPNHLFFLHIKSGKLSKHPYKTFQIIFYFPAGLAISRLLLFLSWLLFQNQEFVVLGSSQSPVADSSVFKLPSY